MASIGALYRYPVKSMLGERLDAATVTPSGILGDRAFAVVDDRDGTVASAKQPRKWARLLEVQAAFVDEPTGDAGAAGPPPVRLTLPDGTELRTDGPDAAATLGRFIGRDVRIVSEAPASATFEEVWPDIDGLAPAEFIASTEATREPTGEPVSAITLSMAAPGMFFDVAALHLLTTSTLSELARLDGDGSFDVRRYRPNVLIDTDDGVGFVENEWPAGSSIGLGEAASATVMIPTMRCVMTTLAQGPSAGGTALPTDRGTLQSIARHNRVEIPGMGTWACAGVYAAVAAGGPVRTGDPVTI
ncbi:MAG: MOSC N-terminal beta barrel domain-containing protein [Acidimicrobiales bacterium]